MKRRRFYLALVLGVFASILFVSATADAYYADIVSPAMKYAIPAGKCRLTLSLCTNKGTLAGKEFRFAVRKEGADEVLEEVKRVTLEDSYFTFRELDFEPGKYEVLVAPLTEGSQAKSISFTVRPADAKPAAGNIVKIDEAGRMILNGEAFLPIGIYTNLHSEKEDFQAWKEAGFNCVMAYDALWWDHPDPKGNPPVYQVIEHSAAKVDEFAAYGLKLLFSIKDIHPKSVMTYGDLTGDKSIHALLVGRFMYHPAVIGWYLNDELIDEAYYKDFRSRVSAMDPFHPTFQVQFGPDAMRASLGYADVAMADPYPFYKEGDGMDSAYVHMRALCDNHGKAIWAVPQTFAWCLFTKNAQANFHPSEQQMRSLILLEALMGAKGFVFFSYGSALNFKKLTGEDTWPVITKFVAMLKGLEPYLLSLEKAPQPQMEKVEGKVFSTAFTAEGKTVVLIAGLSGKQSAELVLPGKPDLKSRFGRTVNLGGGRYRYEGNGADSDILE